ncbi:hypothetical protein NPIL_518381 [Nephila pilipes]|uniref:Uncharacterized protein n=1 Tax=Nephila pilipes TaxID=299642 RepID=A0A8X6NZ37_NEPPI|nr:hypothetical protein NPIL_518381 [Nephila pilipes]
MANMDENYAHTSLHRTLRTLTFAEDIRTIPLISLNFFLSVIADSVSLATVLSDANVLRLNNFFICQFSSSSHMSASLGSIKLKIISRKKETSNFTVFKKERLVFIQRKK